MTMDSNFTGKGRYTLPDHSEYSGDFKDDMPDGIGQFDFSNGDSYEGHWEAGEMSGFGIYRFYNQKLDRFKGMYEGEFQHSKFNGVGKITYPDSTVYYGSWRDGKKEGLGEFFGIHGETIMGRWENDNLVEGVCTFADGSRYVGHFLNSKFNGFGTLILTDNSIRQGYWKDSMLIEGLSFEADQAINKISDNKIIVVEK